ncbi:MAG: dephospho-CoA kinase [Candidatus Midichloriaceae bacterium]|jgi:dephospho-CoA kinase
MKKRLSPRNGKIIAITGNICTGKSFVLNFFKNRGFRTFSLDKFIHKLLLTDDHLKNEVAKAFPDSVVNNEISRDILGKIVFQNNVHLKKLESILHPITNTYLKKLHTETKKNQNTSLVIEIPLLFEKNREKYFDYIIYLSSSIKTMYKRYNTRAKSSKEKFESILNSQISFDKTSDKFDLFIYNENKNYILNTLKKILLHDKFKRNCTGYRVNRTELSKWGQTYRNRLYRIN